MIKYSRDDRYDKAGIATHDQNVTSAYACSNLGDVKDKTKEYGVIGIDEGQFVSNFRYTCFINMLFQFPDIVEFCEEMANDGKTVIVAALDGTFQRKVSGQLIYNLMNSVLGIQCNSGFSTSCRKGR